MYFKQIFDEKLAQYSYIIGCQKNGEALVIDPMRDIDTYIQIAAKENLKIVAAADTHIHADYLSGLRELAERGVKVYASDEGDADWKYEWLNGSKYTYQLLKDGDVFSIGNIRFKAWHTPGHTPEHLSYFVTDGAAADEPLGIATGDFVFVGDVGRPDLLESAAGHVGNMEPSARRLFSTVEKFKSVSKVAGIEIACNKNISIIICLHVVNCSIWIYKTLIARNQLTRINNSPSIDVVASNPYYRCLSQIFDFSNV
jgi:hydroxyacylglutathione hydrolase